MIEHSEAVCVDCTTYGAHSRSVDIPVKRPHQIKQSEDLIKGLEEDRNMLRQFLGTRCNKTNLFIIYEKPC